MYKYNITHLIYKVKLNIYNSYKCYYEIVMYHLSFLSYRNHNLENLIYGHALDRHQLSNSLEYLCKMRIPPVIVQNVKRK